MTAYLQKNWLLLCLVAAIVISFLLGDFIPIGVKSFFFTLSTIIKNILLFLLPLLILPFIANSISGLKGKGAIFLVIILVGATLSLFLAIFYSYFVSGLAFSNLHMGSILDIQDTNEVCTLMDYSVDPFFTVEVALAMGFLMGVILSRMPASPLHQLMKHYQTSALFFFERIFTPLLPVYIFGFLLKISHDSNCGDLFQSFGSIIFLIAGAQVFYIFLYYYLGARSLQQAFIALKVSFPSFVTAFSTISSMVTLPVTLQAAEQNVKHKEVADLTIPATVNCHAIGDAIALPMMAIAIFYMSHHAMPDLWNYFVFASMLTIAQFGAISVAGGSAIIINPILATYLGFSPEMIALITALAILQDPWGTACNVLGNGGYVMILDRLYGRFFSASKRAK